METEVAEPSTETPTLPNPVITPDIEISKQVFRDAMEAEKSKPSEPAPETQPEVSPPPTVSEPKVEDPKVEPPAETPASKSKLPDELITGRKPEVKIDDAIAEFDAMVPPKGAKPDVVTNFGKMKEYAKKLFNEKDAKIRELETRTSDASSRAEIEAAQERIKATEARAKELESTLERVAFTESPRFKQFIADETATITAAKAYFEGTEINPDIVEYAARTTGAQRVKILREAGADPELIAAVQPYLVQYDNIQRYKAGALENWKSESAQMAERQRAHQEAQLAQRVKEEDTIWSNVVAEFTKDIAAYQKFEGHDPWNERADKLLSEAKTDFNGDGVDLKQVAVDMIKAKAYDVEHEIRLAITEELNNVLKENAKLKAAKPNGGSIQGSGAPASEDNLDPIEAAKRRFNLELSKARGG